jgi:hypothetical protein
LSEVPLYEGRQRHECPHLLEGERNYRGTSPIRKGPPP